MQQTQITEEELNARIMALVRQRNESMDREAALAGRAAYLEKCVSILQAELAKEQEKNKNEDRGDAQSVTEAG